jgi:hypothetical protein
MATVFVARRSRRPFTYRELGQLREIGELIQNRLVGRIGEGFEKVKTKVQKMTAEFAGGGLNSGWSLQTMDRLREAFQKYLGGSAAGRWSGARRPRPSSATGWGRPRS